MSSYTPEEFDALMTSVIKWCAHNGLTVEGHFEGHFGITTEVADSIRAELIRLGIARESGAAGMWFLHEPIAEMVQDAAHAKAELASVRADAAHLQADLTIVCGERDEAIRELRMAHLEQIRARGQAAAWRRNTIVAVALAVVLAVALAWCVIA